MTISIQKIEWIGKKVKIVKSQNKTLTNIQGMIVDETKNTFTLLRKDVDKKIKIMKNICVFQINHNNKTYEIEGEKLLKRSEERIKA